jgi:hypothetical protein
MPTVKDLLDDEIKTVSKKWRLKNKGSEAPR